MVIKAIVTGHSKGLGAGMARALCDRGVKVLGLSRSHLEEDRPSPALFGEKSLDLSDMAAVEHWIKDGRMASFLQDADEALLINNAGLLEPIGPVGMQDPEGIIKAVTVNVTGPLVLSDAFIRASALVHDRRIAHISSGAGRSAYAGWSVYCATKAALDHHARATQLDQVKDLKIASVAPGVIDTAMQNTIRKTDLDRFPNRQRFEDLKSSGSLSDPNQAGAALVDWMLSDAFGMDATPDIRELCS